MKITLCTFIPFAGLLAFVLPAASAQSATFTVSQHGTKVGTASFDFAPSADGFRSSSLVRVKMQGLDYALSKSEELSTTRSLHHVQLSGTVNNSAVNVAAKPDGSQFLINISANGRSTTTRLDEHSRTVFLADFDPGAFETLLALAAKSNNRDIWVIVPKQAGSIEAVQLATYADEQGTLNDKPIAVHHLVATIGGARTDLFSGPDDQLLQAELPQEGFALVRNGFVLKPPSKPGAPPPAPSASQGAVGPTNQ
jgi:hypothetical protein